MHNPHGGDGHHGHCPHCIVTAGAKLVQADDYSAKTAKIMLTCARPEIGKNEISGHQKNKISVAATQQR
jgi:hypothetical protein